MRAIACLLLLGCATSNEPTSTVTLTCSTSLADYCSQHGCDLTPDMAEHETGWRVSNSWCGAYDLVSLSAIDLDRINYYRNGLLVAIEVRGLAPDACVGGPAMFAAPRCDPP